MATTITGWRAYFTGGVIRTSKTVNRWNDLPQDSMLGLVVYFLDNKKRRFTGGDYYYVNVQQDKYGCDKGDAVSLALKYPGAFLIRGVWTDDEAMRLVNARMKSDSAP